MSDRKARALSAYAAGAPVTRCAVIAGVSTSAIYRWAAQHGWPPRSQQQCELWRAQTLAEDAAKINAALCDVQATARRLRAPPHIIRAALYLHERSKK